MYEPQEQLTSLRDSKTKRAEQRANIYKVNIDYTIYLRGELRIQIGHFCEARDLHPAVSSPFLRSAKGGQGQYTPLFFDGRPYDFSSNRKRFL